MKQCLTRTSLPQTYHGSVLNPLVISSPNCQPHGCCHGLRLTANAVSSMLPSLCPQSSQFPSPAFLVDFLQLFTSSASPVPPSFLLLVFLSALFLLSLLISLKMHPIWRLAFCSGKITGYAFERFVLIHPPEARWVLGKEACKGK